MASDLEERIRDIQREYIDFLDDVTDQGIYKKKVHQLITGGEERLIVNINDLRRKNPRRAAGLLTDSFEELIAFQRALKELVASADPTYSKEHEELFIGLEGSFGANHVTPRTLTSSYLGVMVCVEGIVTKCSLIRPKIVRSVHYCPATKKTIERRYTDMTSLDAHPSSSVYPTMDEDGNLLETEFGLSSYKDHQTFSVQEMPEKAPPGQLPRSVDIIADNDLVDRCKPGDRVQVIGTYRCLPAKKNGYSSCTFRTILIANNIKLLSKEVAHTVNAEDVALIKQFAKSKKHNVFDLLARSMAPSIHGHEYIKRAVLCMLLGGNEKVLDNGSRIRGDINILLIGDPSVAKSQMLRYVLNTAPRAIPTTGRGSSGVGLTAAVTTDQESGERRLEAGAMVLADRGIVCIDEFDKMSDIDRTAIHEVMEQGRVTIAKAGIHAKLNARCSVLAAANPVYGRYDQYKTPMENIGLQDSLLSRFDLLFIVLDKMDPESDRRIADHVLRMHRYRGSGEQDGDVLPMGSAVEMLATQDPDAERDEVVETQVYEKYDHLLHGATRSRKENIVTKDFMRKFLHLAKSTKPTLTRQAAEYISEEYAKLRNQDTSAHENVARTQPVTARALETIIRLATAHAKGRLSKTVDLQDAQSAVELVEFSYFKKVLKKRRKQRGDDSDEEGSQDDEEGGDDGGDDDGDDQPPKKRKRPGKRGDEDKGKDDPYDLDKEDDTPGTPAAKRGSPRRQRKTPTPRKEAEDQPSTSSGPQTAPGVSQDRLASFRGSIYRLFKDSRGSQTSSLDNLREFVNSEHETQPFDEDELFAAINKMMDANQIMLSGNTVFLI